MTTTPYPPPFSPDSPLQRLPWILVLAILLVVLALAGLGRVLRAPPQPTHKPKPLRARIYELPASPGSAGARPRQQSHHHAPSHPAHRHPAERVRHPAQSHAAPAPHHPATKHPATKHPAKRSQATSPESSSRKGAELAKPGHRHPRTPAHNKRRSHAAAKHPAPAPEHARPKPQPRIDWSKLPSQINAAVQQSEPLLPQMHDPDTLVARYYLASLLKKLQRVGDMEYPGELSGTPIIKLVVGPHGNLLHLTLLRSSGNRSLDQSALQIARDSAPFGPFPDKLQHQTSHLELICRMNFEGDREINAGY
ncbi:MAG TPA: TonB family protein [Gammaproteobacteria bacterium]|nr:TonB family protein [Gammaproteobacteria bacterium]